MVRLLWLIVILLPVLAFGGERCSQYGGVCRDRCLETERVEAGDFLDCGDRDECCVPKNLGGQGDTRKDEFDPGKKISAPKE